MNKDRVKKLKTAFFHTLAFTKEDEFIGKAIVNRKRSNNQYSRTLSNRDFAMTINKKKERLNRIFTKAEKVTKNLFLEEQRNKKLEDMLNEFVNKDNGDKKERGDGYTVAFFNSIKGWVNRGYCPDCVRYTEKVLY